MGVLRRLTEETVLLTGVTGTSTSAVYDVAKAKTIGVQTSADVNTGSAKTFDSGTAQVTNITFNATVGGGHVDAADYLIFYALDTDGVTEIPYAIYADLTGTGPVPTGASYLAIPAAHRGAADLSSASTGDEVATAAIAAFNALTGFTALATSVDTGDPDVNFTMTNRGPASIPESFAEDGTPGGNFINNVVVLTAGVVSEVDVAANTVSVPSHGYFTGEKGRLTTTGTLPAGLATGTDYYLVVVSASVFGFASSLANALLGTKINITNQGSNGAVNTFTPTALASAGVKLQQSNDPLAATDPTNAIWSDLVAEDTVTIDEIIYFEKVTPTCRWMRIWAHVASGSMSIVNYLLIKGEEP
jgi:hypothetical protein